MNEDHGVWKYPVPDCNHKNSVRLTTCSVCPTCETFTPHAMDLTECYKEIVSEIAWVQDYGSTDPGYLGVLDKAATYIESQKK